MPFFINLLATISSYFITYSQTMTTLADIKAKFYNLLAEKKMAKQGKNVVALTSAVYDEITTSLTAIVARIMTTP